MCSNNHHDDVSPAPTDTADVIIEREWTASRRLLLKAGATFSAIAAMGGLAGNRADDVVAQETPAGETRGQRWNEADHQSDVSVADAAGKFAKADFPFTAVGASWPGDAGAGYSVAYTFPDGSEVTVGAAIEDGRRPNREGRIFAHLAFADGATSVRYRVLDASGAEVTLPGFQLVFIDASAGPTSGGSPAAVVQGDLLTKPPVVSRKGWGANENYRMDDYGEMWPREYQLVEHVIIHHTVTPNFQDPYVTIRSVYYYHAVELEWGDIGYNYLVGWNGTVFEGRAGGDNVVGGHSFQYSFGSAGIGTMGTFSANDVTSNCLAAIIAIVAWVGRNLDPLGKSTFHEAANLPTICGHRDTNISECPGGVLYSRLPGIRNAVSTILENSDIPPDGGVPDDGAEFGTGSNVIITKRTNVRWDPSLTGRIRKAVDAGTQGAVNSGLRTVDGLDWYWVNFSPELDGYVLAKFLDPAPVGNPPLPTFELGDRVRVTIDELNLRRRPGIAQPTPYTLGLGTLLWVTVQQRAETGYRWWGVSTDDNATGWVVQQGIELVAPRRHRLSRTSGETGVLVTGTLTGMPRNRTVNLTWDGAPLNSVTTNNFGEATTSFRVPLGTKGEHLVRAVVGRARAYARFSIVPRIGLMPRTAAAGDQVLVVLSGFDAGDTVNIQLQRGKVFETVSTTTTTELGGARLRFTVPEWASGNIVIQATSAASLAQSRITITSSGADVPTPTPSPTATPSPTPTPNGTPEATATAEPTSPAETPTPEPTPEPTAPPTETPAPEPTPTETPVPPTETPTPEPTQTPTPDPTEEP